MAAPDYGLGALARMAMIGIGLCVALVAFGLPALVGIVAGWLFGWSFWPVTAIAFGFLVAAVVAFVFWPEIEDVFGVVAKRY